MLSFVLAFVLLAAVLPSAQAEGLLGYLDELGMDGSRVPSFARWMGREPDNQRVREDGCIVQQFRALGGNANLYDFFMDLKSIGCSVGRLHWENGGALQFITAVYDGNVFTISYRPDTDTVEIVYPPASEIAILEPMFPEDGGFALAGKSVLFGRYEQDNDFSNDSEPIEWVIVDQAGERVLLLSRRILDVQAYNAVDDAAAPATTWEGSTLRAWLNREFLDTAFTASEQSILLPVTQVTANAGYDEITTERVTLLRQPDVFYNVSVDFDMAMREIWPCDVAPRAAARGLRLSGLSYWCAGIGAAPQYAEEGGADGGFTFPPESESLSHEIVSNNELGVRPVIWLARDTVDALLAE